MTTHALFLFGAFSVCLSI